jgi:glutamine amidotransferase
MGWNNLEKTPAGTEHRLVNDMAEGSHAYFVHSYAFFPEKPAHVLSVTDYGGPVTAIIGRDNMIGTQFHPEKSQSVGLRFLESFLSWYP